MKTSSIFAVLLFVLLFLSTGNDCGGIVEAEADKCRQDSECIDYCKRKLGDGATGFCNDMLTCQCSRPPSF